MAVRLEQAVWNAYLIGRNPKSFRGRGEKRSDWLRREIHLAVAIHASNHLSYRRVEGAAVPMRQILRVPILKSHAKREGQVGLDFPVILCKRGRVRRVHKPERIQRVVPARA